jgi:hypothetical protein
VHAPRASEPHKPSSCTRWPTGDNHHWLPRPLFPGQLRREVASCLCSSRPQSARCPARAGAPVPSCGSGGRAGGTAPERSLSFIPTGDGRAPRPCERRAAAVPLLIWRASSSDGTCSAARRGMPPPQGGPAVRLVPSPPPPAAQAIERGAAGVLALRSDPDDERPAVPCRSKRGVGSGGPRAEPPDEPPPGTGSERGRRRRPAPAQSCRRLAQ